MFCCPFGVGESDSEGVDCFVFTGAVFASGVEVYFVKVDGNGDGNFDIYYTQSSETSVRMRGGETSNVKATCEGKTLRFYVVGLGHNDSDNVDIYITSPVLKGITLNGSGDFESENPLKTDEIEIRVNNEGDVMLRSLDCSKCDAKVMGEGDIDIDRISAQFLIAETRNEGCIDLQNAHIGLFLSLTRFSHH